MRGETMGTTFKIVYQDSMQRVFDSQVDSLLHVVNNSMSTYIPNSVISNFNRFDTTLSFSVDRHFYRVFLKAKEVYGQSSGAFNPAVMPLVRYWGFAADKMPEHIDSARVDSLLSLIHFDEVSGAMILKPGSRMDTHYVIEKANPNIQLDFSAIAKGYGVDVIFEFLRNRGAKKVFVEIGGEVRASGKDWGIGIEDPVNSTVSERKALAVIQMNGNAIATSGNYRNIREVDGVKYAHTINPFTGYPEQNHLLSVSIVAPDCMTADAYATACMVLGLEKAKNLLASNQKLEGFLVYSLHTGEIQTYRTKGFPVLTNE
jgi:FAD:protein FMN transferase